MKHGGGAKVYFKLCKYLLKQKEYAAEAFLLTDTDDREYFQWSGITQWGSEGKWAATVLKASMLLFN